MVSVSELVVDDGSNFTGGQRIEHVRVLNPNLANVQLERMFVAHGGCLGGFERVTQFVRKDGREPDESADPPAVR